MPPKSNHNLLDAEAGFLPPRNDHANLSLTKSRIQDWCAYGLRVVRGRVNRILGPTIANRMARHGNRPIPVFFYHRVADHHPNPWSMPCEQFERQINEMSRTGEIIGLDEVQRRVRMRQSKTPASAVTFDDGYAENSNFALPLLARLKVPCTYFVSVDHIRYGKPFPHDEAAGYHFAPNTADELRHWSEAGIEIGLHTRSHFDFATGDDDSIIEREITSAYHDLQEMIGRPVRYFAFPYGLPAQLRPRVIQAIHALGMSGFCSAFGGYNLADQDPFHIRRVHGDVQQERFENWLHIDPRKLRGQPLVEYEIDQPKHQTVYTEVVQC